MDKNAWMTKCLYIFLWPSFPFQWLWMMVLDALALFTDSSWISKKQLGCQAPHLPVTSRNSAGWNLYKPSLEPGIGIGLVAVLPNSFKCHNANRVVSDRLFVIIIIIILYFAFTYVYVCVCESDLCVWCTCICTCLVMWADARGGCWVSCCGTLFLILLRLGLPLIIELETGSPTDHGVWDRVSHDHEAVMAANKPW